MILKSRIGLDNTGNTRSNCPVIWSGHVVLVHSQAIESELAGSAGVWRAGKLTIEKLLVQMQSKMWAREASKECAKPFNDEKIASCEIVNVHKHIVAVL